MRSDVIGAIGIGVFSIFIIFSILAIIAAAKEHTREVRRFFIIMLAAFEYGLFMSIYLLLI